MEKRPSDISSRVGEKKKKSSIRQKPQNSVRQNFEP